jgi:hypothetical protein
VRVAWSEKGMLAVVVLSIVLDVVVVGWFMLLV